jgi:Xaa-Pro aminopeptidase
LRCRHRVACLISHPRRLFVVRTLVLALLLVGSDLIPIKYWRGSEAATPDVEWIVVDELIRKVRLVKSARELTAFRCAGEIVSS